MYEPAYFNELADVIGHDASDVARWLAAHPSYIGSIWFSNGDGGDDVEVTEVFFPEVDEDADGIGIEEMIDNVRAIMSRRVA